MRMHVRRFTRPTKGFSKKMETHANAVSLHFMYYKFVRIYASLRITPAMASGVTGKLREIANIMTLIEAKEAESLLRGPCKSKEVTEAQ